MQKGSLTGSSTDGTSFLCTVVMIVTEEEKTEALVFYRESLEMLYDTGIDFMLGGAFATFHYTGLYRDTKDLDVFCKPGHYPAILKYFQDKGFKTELTDVRWLVKIFKGEYYIDIIFNSVNNICTVDDTWLSHASQGEFAGMPVKFLSAEDLIFCKIFVQNRERYDGADINHVLVRYGQKLDWKRLMNKLEPHWHLLLGQLINFQYVYPSDYRDIIPRWLFDELIERAKSQYDLPPSLERVCRGPVIDNTQYSVDVKEWNYKSLTIKTV